MALHNLKIIVVDGGKNENFNYSQQNIDEKGNADIKNSSLYKLMNAKDTIKNKVRSGTSPSTAMAINMGLSVASQFVKQTANYYISDIGRRNGDSNYQSIINRQLEIVSDVASVGSGLISGASTGAMFGPIGMMVGAVLGVVSSGISLGFKYAERTREYQHEMFKNNTNQAYNMARANYSYWTGRAR